MPIGWIEVIFEKAKREQGSLVVRMLLALSLLFQVTFATLLATSVGARMLATFE